MDDFGIARARLGTDRVRRFEDQSVEALRGEAARDGKTDHAGARNYAVDLFHARPLGCACAVAKPLQLYSLYPP